MVQSGGDPKLDRTTRDELSRKCLGRILVLLRETIDLDPKLLQRIKADPNLWGFSRPELKDWLGNLAELARTRPVRRELATRGIAREGVCRGGARSIAAHPQG